MRRGGGVRGGGRVLGLEEEGGRRRKVEGVHVELGYEEGGGSSSTPEG